MHIASLEHAIKQGTTPGQLFSAANSNDRESKSHESMNMHREAQRLAKSAKALRALARELAKHLGISELLGIR